MLNPLFPNNPEVKSDKGNVFLWLVDTDNGKVIGGIQGRTDWRFKFDSKEDFDDFFPDISKTEAADPESNLYKFHREAEEKDSSRM